MPAIVVALILCLAAIPFFRQVLRVRSFRKLAVRRKLEYLKWELMDFPTNLLDVLPCWDKAHNVYIAHEHHDLLMTFDIESGYGRGSYGRTIVARRFEQVPEREPKLPVDYLVLSNDRWRVVTLKSRWPGSKILSPEVIEQLWDRLA